MNDNNLNSIFEQINNLKKPVSDSKEETIAMAVLLGVASILFKDLTMYNVSVMNILLFLIVIHLHILLKKIII